MRAVEGGREPGYWAPLMEDKKTKNGGASIDNGD